MTPTAAPRRSSTAPARRWVVAIDVGGTFTDAVGIAEDGGSTVAKVPSTPEDPAIGLVAAIEELAEAGVAPRGITAMFHGTTVATNAVITGRLARVVLITTQGYRAVL